MVQVKSLILTLGLSNIILAQNVDLDKLKDGLSKIPGDAQNAFKDSIVPKPGANQAGGPAPTGTVEMSSMKDNGEAKKPVDAAETTGAAQASATPEAGKSESGDKTKTDAKHSDDDGHSHATSGADKATPTGVSGGSSNSTKSSGTGVSSASGSKSNSTSRSSLTIGSQSGDHQAYAQMSFVFLTATTGLLTYLMN